VNATVHAFCTAAVGEGKFRRASLPGAALLTVDIRRALCVSRFTPVVGHGGVAIGLAPDVLAAFDLLSLFFKAPVKIAGAFWIASVRQIPPLAEFSH
jgi:hypothetical protein